MRRLEISKHIAFMSVVFSTLTCLSSGAIAGQALEYLGLVVFAMWMALATSLLEAGSYGSADTEDMLRARSVSRRRNNGCECVGLAD